jgi:hypothetical protein
MKEPMWALGVGLLLLVVGLILKPPNPPIATWKVIVAGVTALLFIGGGFALFLAEESRVEASGPVAAATSTLDPVTSPSTAVPSPSESRPPGREPTEVHSFEPVGSEGLLPQYKTTAPTTGDCGGRSASSPERQDAWRCFTRESILDPCFSTALVVVQTLYCFSSPWDSKAVAVQAKVPYGEPGVEPSPGTSIPWAVELVNGTRCTSQGGGTTSEGAGGAWWYMCDDGGSLLAKVVRRGQWWYVTYGRPDETPDTEEVRVAHLWK